MQSPNKDDDHDAIELILQLTQERCLMLTILKFPVRFQQKSV